MTVVANPLKSPLGGIERAMDDLQTRLAGELEHLAPIHHELIAVRAVLERIADRLDDLVAGTDESP